MAFHDAQFMQIVATADAINRGLKGQTESYVTALWTNIVSCYFPLTVNDGNGRGGYMLNHEFYGDQGGISKCDMVIVHTTVTTAQKRIYAPLFCLEAKAAGGSLSTARDQLIKAGTNVLIKSELARPDGQNIQSCFGVVVAGNKFQLYEFDIRGDTDVSLITPIIGGTNYSEGREMSLAIAADRLKLENFFWQMKAVHEIWFRRTFF